MPRCDLVDERLQTQNVAEKLGFVAGVVGHLTTLVDLLGASASSNHLMASSKTYQFNTQLPFIHCQIDLPGEVMKMPDQWRHDLLQTRAGIWARGSDNGLGESCAIGTGLGPDIWLLHIVGAMEKVFVLELRRGTVLQKR